MLTSTANSFAHTGHQHQPKSNQLVSILADYSSNTDKYELNNGDQHYGHFYIKRSKVKKNTEKLVIEQTFHRESGDVVKKIKALLDRNTKALNYSFELEDENLKYYIFTNLNNLDGSDNAVHRVIVDTNNGSISYDDFNLNLTNSSSHTGHNHSE